MNYRSFRKKININLNNETRANSVALLTVGFAFIYHFACLFVFYFLRIKTLFCFNIASVIIFASVGYKVVKNGVSVPLYLVCLTEIVIHQIIADYCLGGAAAFHYFILLIGFMPFLLFENKLKLSLFLEVFCSSVFALLEFFRFPPKYSVSPSVLSALRVTNISLTVIVMLIVLLLFTMIVRAVEQGLESEIEKKSQELQLQNKKVISMQENTIISLANLVENRDIDTGEHVKRTSAYVNLLAKRAKKDPRYAGVLSDYYISLLTKAAPMHDIGKITVSDSILKKPGKLTEDEFKQMQRHTVEGKRIAQEVLIDEDAEYLQIVSDVTLSHHEKWNGGGYPNRLRENEIPISARIMAIADVFDALVSPRCYKSPVSLKDAFEIIENSAGTHFDPVLVVLFLDIKEEITYVMNAADR